MAMSDSAMLNAGERLALQCAVVKGGLPLFVSWSKDGQVIAPTTATTTTSVRLVNEFTATLTIESLTGQHGFRAALAFAISPHHVNGKSLELLVEK
ncbi:hypothetical protein OUZ56_005859 [Daphnia magna]|uniref:Ig-like domain-containing protein n=1 Tax=Daphnia magna TaxID=35525 RepID=A0ABQ9YTZ2_9CRUS|nr:hypothetical protein OUZ56_005859 [Daphnia magna]